MVWEKPLPFGSSKSCKNRTKRAHLKQACWWSFCSRSFSSSSLISAFGKSFWNCWLALTNLSASRRLSWIPQCFQAPSTLWASQGYSTCRTRVAFILWQRESSWSGTSCCCRSSRCWISVTEVFSFELWVAVGLQLENRIVQIKSWTLKIWMFNDVVMWEGGHAVCKWFSSKA